VETVDARVHGVSPCSGGTTEKTGRIRLREMTGYRRSSPEASRAGSVRAEQGL
jgi:hypothetical protein